MPTTSYILDMMKALYVTNSDPSEMGNDPVNGLEEKERDYAKLTHEYLETLIPDYEAKEARIAATVGSKLTELMLGFIPITDFSQTPPTVTFSNFIPYTGSSSSSSDGGSSSSAVDTNIYVGQPYYLDAVVTGGNMNMTAFTYAWTVLKEPSSGQFTASEYSSISTPTIWDIISVVTFAEAGSYTIQLKVTSTVYTDISAQFTISVRVI